MFTCYTKENELANHLPLVCLWLFCRSFVCKCVPVYAYAVCLCLCHMCGFVQISCHSYTDLL
jgi:hypothetical protein